MRRIWGVILGSIAAVGAASAPTDADDPPAKVKEKAGAGDSATESARAAEAVVGARKEAERYRFELDGAGAKGAGSATSPTLVPKALLQWSNPVAGSIHGSVFVWTDRGRPAVVASIYQWFATQHHRGVELHALAPGLVSADRNGKRIWSPSRPGIALAPIPGAPAPADTASGRLRQLRSLAKEFSATQTTREGVSRELRLLTQPLYRYESTSPDVIDGGLFAFVQGTDPEIVLLIEARKATSGAVEWQFAGARMNSITLQLKHRGLAAWTAPEIPWSQARNHREPYSLFIFDPDPGMGAGDD